ncbi:hypothetical protein HRM2_19120 [Desulforapulum autotrophicum HRM2]|uniref:Uncharacterized protein n=1 Tax=Desulforapulum autotrophicum (strain ATCC 43914 / DSM 3382 / VKM B-1955 / HRM2) TaxID=177437 RepID=C0QC01_DESAH|nr:hypothetical protein HRM2_19120 [Desulforapulum autotrophicum HRM2]
MLETAHSELRCFDEKAERHYWWGCGGFMNVLFSAKVSIGKSDK